MRAVSPTTKDRWCFYCNNFSHIKVRWCFRDNSILHINIR